MIVLSIAGGIYLPIALSSATRQFGALGVSFTYVTWLFVIMFALVGSTDRSARSSPGMPARSVASSGIAGAER